MKPAPYERVRNWPYYLLAVALDAIYMIMFFKLMEVKP
jgi:hypothetical protein